MKAPESHPISVSNHLLSSLLDGIPHIEAFKGKLSLIRAKLTEFAEFPDSFTKPLSLDLLHSISHTLNNPVSLCDKCQTRDCLECKLKTQSDIYSVLAKLDCHVKDNEILIWSGVLQDSGILGTSSCSSKRETVRAESRNLITRLQIGTADSKSSTMDSLLRLLEADDKNVMIVVAQGTVPVLARLLDLSAMEMKEKAVVAILRISMVDSSKPVLMAEVFTPNRIFMRLTPLMSKK